MSHESGRLTRVSTLLGDVLAAVSMVAVIAMMVHVVADVSLRFLRNQPIGGTIEVVSFWWMPMIAFLSLAICQRFAQHVDIQLLTGNLPPRLNAAFSALAIVVSLVVVVLIGWFGWVNARQQTAMHEAALGAVTVPIWPVRYLVPLGCAVFALQLVTDLVAELVKVWRGEAAAPAVVAPDKGAVAEASPGRAR